MKNYIIPDENTLRVQLLCGREIYCRIRHHYDGKEEDVRLCWSKYHGCVTVDHLPGPGRYSLSNYYEEKLPFDILYIEGRKTKAHVRWIKSGNVEDVNLIYDRGGIGVTVERLNAEDKYSTYSINSLPFKVLSEKEIEEE